MRLFAEEAFPASGEVRLRGVRRSAGERAYPEGAGPAAPGVPWLCSRSRSPARFQARHAPVAGRGRCTRTASPRRGTASIRSRRGCDPAPRRPPGSPNAGRAARCGLCRPHRRLQPAVRPAERHRQRLCPRSGEGGRARSCLLVSSTSHRRTLPSLPALAKVVDSHGCSPASSASAVRRLQNATLVTPIVWAKTT